MTKSYKVISNGLKPNPINVYKNSRYELIKDSWAELYRHKTTGAFLVRAPGYYQLITLCEEIAVKEFSKAVHCGNRPW